MRASKKNSISTNRKSTTRFPTSHRWTLDVTHKPLKGWHKTRFCYFFSRKFQLLSKNVCGKVSSCENFQRQSCSYIVPLSNGLWATFPSKICAQSDPPPSENADFDIFRLIVPQAWELAKKCWSYMLIIAFGRQTVPERGVVTVTWPL